MALLIGISGRKRHGKNTVADFMQAISSVSTSQFAFADELKQDVANMMQISLEDVNYRKGELRGLMQDYGAYNRKHRGEDYWIRRLDVRLSASPMAVKLITDVRYPNEAEFVRKRGGVVVKVVRDMGAEVDTHESETSVDLIDPDYTIENDGTVADLLNKVTVTFREIYDAQGEVGAGVGGGAQPPIPHLDPNGGFCAAYDFTI